MPSPLSTALIGLGLVAAIAGFAVFALAVAGLAVGIEAALFVLAGLDG